MNDRDHENDGKLILISSKEVCRRIPFSRAQINNMVRAGEFPRPVPIGPKRRAFIESEVEAWIAAKVAERDRHAGRGEAD